jgi:hypothetical protein
MAVQPHSGLGHLIFEVPRSHTNAHSVGLLWRSDQSIAEAVTYATHNEHKRRTCMPSAGFKPAIPEIERLKTYALDHKVTGIKMAHSLEIRSFVRFLRASLSSSACLMLSHFEIRLFTLLISMRSRSSGPRCSFQFFLSFQQDCSPSPHLHFLHFTWFTRFLILLQDCNTKIILACVFSTVT